MTEEITKIKELVSSANHVVILQADNPDGDSLGSALALEQILGSLGKTVSLYCAVDMPTYLRYLEGWDRVTNELPKQFDLSIIVDASTLTLFEKLRDSGQQGWVSSRPCIVLDHHASVENEIPFASILINPENTSSTGELIYTVAKQAEWPINTTAMEYMLTAILGDTQGLSNQLATPKTYRTVAEFIEAGVNRPSLEEARRQASKMPEAIFRYKGELISRASFVADNQIAYVVIPQSEITKFSPLYNPAPLIQTDMLQTEAVGVAIVLKHYSDGKITGSIRCNPGYEIGADLATAFGGGGHPFASGFKITDGRGLEEIKNAVIIKASDLIAARNQNETA